jgi:hypothetical protein
MGVTALFAWLTTSGLGLVMLTTWLARIGSVEPVRNVRLHNSRPPPYIPAALVVSHLLLATGGLIVWGFYLAVDANALKWLALGMLLPVELMGASMFIRWIGSRRLRWAAKGGSARPGPPESLLPVVIVYGHGVGGAVTLSLVALTSLGVGGS